MRTHLNWLAAAAAATVLGCAGGSQAPLAPSAPPQDPAVPAVSGSAGLGQALQSGLYHESALAIYTLEVDPAALTATARLKEVRQGQATDDLYLLSIDSFLRADSFRVTSLSATADAVALTYALTHPFPAARDPLGTPNGFDNRADLGIAGKVLFLLDVPSATGNTYFGNRIANTSAVVNADAHYAPAALITLSGMTANTFPYKVLVDELADPRRGVSNSGQVTGNYGSDGWTRAEFGPNNNGWAGYGVLHQGQTASNTVEFDKAQLGSGLSLDVAVIAKYNDPRGGVTPAQKKANRLPPATADASLFAYRMPHGALDVERIAFLGEDGTFIANQISGSGMSFAVTDWDAKATATAFANLADDPVFTNVAQGENGVPSLAVDIPGVLGAPDTWAPATEDGSGTGVPGNPLIYVKTVTKTVTMGQSAGTFTGMVRAIDPESGLMVPLDGNLSPITFNAPVNETFQVFTVDMQPDNQPPTATVVLTSSNPLLSGTAPSVDITGITDTDGDPLDIEVDWGDGNGFQTVVSGLNPPYTNQSANGPVMNNATLTPAPRPALVRISDGEIDTDYPIPFNLGPNRPPQVTGTPALLNASETSPALFTMNAGTATAIDPEGDTISYTIVNNRNADQLTFPSFPNAANTTAVLNPPHSNVTFTIYANDPLHPTTSGTVYPTVVGTVINPFPPAGWVYAPNTQVTGAESARGIAVSSSGNVYLIGAFQNNTNWGGGPLTSALTPRNSIVALDADGNYLWDRNLGTPTSAWVDTMGIGADSAGNVIVYGYWRQTMDFGFGPETNNTSASSSNYDTFVCKYGPTGTPLWNARSNGDGTSTGITDFQEFNGLAVDQATGDVVITGRFNRTETWGSVSLVGVAGPTGSAHDPYVVRISAAGVPLWGTTFNAPAAGNESGQASAFTPTGDIIVGGFYRDLCDFGGGPRNADTSGDGFVLRLNGATGAHVWDYVFDGTGAQLEYVNAVAADGSRAYATGRYYNTTDFGGGPRASGGTASSPFIVALDLSTGAYVWDRTFTGSTSVSQGRGIAVSGTGVFATGEWFTNDDFGSGPVAAAGGSDIYLVKLNPATGANLWVSLIGGSAADIGRSVALTAAGSPVVAGSYSTTVDFDPGPGVTSRTSVGSTDAFGLKLDGGTGTFFP